MTITEVENAIYDWINGLLGLQVIFAHPNAPRPKTSYVLINIFDINQNGTPETDSTLLVDDSTDNIYSAQKEYSISINTYYSGAYQSAADIRNSLSKLLTQEQLYTAGLGYLMSGNIQKLTEEIDKEFEERAQFDIFFSVRSQATENIEAIKKIEINNTTIGES